MWDAAANARAPYTSVASPALEGTFTEGGTTYKTVLTLFKESQKQHTLDWASEKTGIPAARIEERVRASGQGEISTTVLGEMAAEELRGINKVAYVRFASVYREFTDISSFTNEISRLLDDKEAHRNG